jgi:NUDIX domain
LKNWKIKNIIKQKYRLLIFGMLQTLKISSAKGAELLNKHSNRAAVIPYIIKSDKENCEIWFLMGIHKKTKEITDFGGGVKKGENDLEAALRELNEETRDIFKDFVNINDFLDCTVATTTQTKFGKNNRPSLFKTEKFELVSKITSLYGMSVIFLPIDEKWFETAELFFKSTLSDISYRDSDNNLDFCYPNEELSEIIWINESTFTKLINVDSQKLYKDKFKMWNKLQKFYSLIYNKNIRQSLYEKWNNQKFTLLHTNEE